MFKALNSLKTFLKLIQSNLGMMMLAESGARCTFRDFNAYWGGMMQTPRSLANVIRKLGLEDNA